MIDALYHYPPEHARFVLRQADGLTLVFDRVSGHTHILAPEAMALLTCLESGPADAQAALQRLQTRYDMETPDDLLAGVAQQLEALYDLGLANKSPGSY